MAREIELRIIDINKKEAAKRLKSLGAKHVAFRNFKRLEVRLINTPKLKRWLRLRSDGKTTRFTMKENRAGKHENVHEYELSVDDFKTMGLIIQEVFSKNKKAYVESERDEYVLEGTEVTLNKWPKIPPFMEIEGRSKEKINDVYKKLKIKGKPIGNVWDVYTLYGTTFAKVSFKSNAYIKRALKAHKD
jgi:adenylate cyclase, class 2